MEPQLQLKRIAAAITFVVAASTTVYAQNAGKLDGKIVDIETLQPISGVSVSLVGTNQGTTTNSKGEFTLNIITKGEVKIVSSYVGYSRDTTAVEFTSGILPVNIALVSEKSTLDEVVITRRRNQVSELAILDERKKSNLMLEKIGAQELTRKGVSDAEGALTKLSGITKSASGANVFVRGLGDRYNSTTLNGLALPSEDPLNKNISLDFFGTSVIQSVSVNKTYNPSIMGDVAGANIDIISKEFTDDAFIEVGASAGINSQAVKATDFKRISGTNWFGSLKEKSYNISDFSKYSFKNKWDPTNVKNPVNSSYSLSAGKKFRLGDGNLNVFLTGNLNSEYTRFNGQVRQTITDGTISIDQEMQRSQYNVSKTGMANLKYTFGNHYIAFNSLYIGDQVQDYANYYGFDGETDKGDKRIFRRNDVIDNQLYVNQLLSKLNLTDRFSLDLGLGYNVVNGNEPDRRTVNLREPVATPGKFLIMDDGNGSDNERYYSKINEHGWAAKAIATYKFKNDENLDRKVEFGYNGEIVDRDFTANSFYHDINNGADFTVTDPNNINNIFNQQRLDEGFFNLIGARGSSFTSDWYKGSRDIHSALGMATYQFNERLTALLGLRFDKVLLDVTWDTNAGSSELSKPVHINKNYFLPSLNLKYSLTDKSSLRFAGSRSYTLPQFVELAPFRQTFPTYKSNGNSKLVPVENTNFDLKWELFPTDGELISIGTFYKLLKNPIARVESNSGGVLMSYENVGATARLLGLEAELKKNLLKTESNYGTNILSAGANVSYLYSKQELSASSANFTDSESKLQGASPLLLNADLSYLVNGNDWNMTSSLVFNYFSDRIYSLGYSNFHNAIEKSVSTMDFVANATVHKKWGLSLKARNLLNPSYRIEREFENIDNIVLQNYKRGIDVSLGLSYKF